MSLQIVLLPTCTRETLSWFEEVPALLIEKTEFSIPVTCHMHQGFPDSVGDLHELQELQEELATQQKLEHEQQGLDALDSLTYHQLIAQYEVVGTSRY
ncbi:hypothetical protein Tco_0844119 [Tanacetum coccineum]